MKGNKKSLLVVALLLLVGVTSAYVAYSYAKYTSTITGNQGTVQVAKWDFVNDNPTGTITVNLAQTYHATTLKGTNAAGKKLIAPGTEGSFDVTVYNTDSEVGVDFEVALDSITGIPTNLKFYSDANHQNEIVPGNATTGKITGQLEPNDSTGQVVHFYWAWAYDSNADSADTTDGEAANALTIGVTIKGTQVQPSTTAISSHVNQ